MKITDISSAPESEFAYLKQQLEDLPIGCTYSFQGVRLTKNCNPRISTLIFMHTTNDKYRISFNPSVDYTGTNENMHILCAGGMDFAEFSSLEEFCRALPGPKSNNITELHPHSINPRASPGIPDGSLENVTDWSAISVPSETEKKRASFEQIKDELSKVVVGQDEAVETVAYQLSSHLKKKEPKRPVSFLAYGPPGTGKSETAKALAPMLSKITDYEYTAVWTDLNTFTEGHSVYRLTGAPPGYIGYEDKPIFEAVTNNPRTVFIFDELDKAHPEVLKTFMAILDEGRCASRTEQSNHSREYDFRYCIFFFTSNYDLNNSNNTRRIGFSAPEISKIQIADSFETTVRYTDENKISTPSLTYRIYANNEKARKAFVDAGALREIASRFQCFVGYNPLSDNAKKRILVKQVLEAAGEYGIKLVYIESQIVQGLVSAAMSEDVLTVRSFKPVVEGYLGDIFADHEVSEDNCYLRGSLEEPMLIPAEV